MLDNVACRDASASKNNEKGNISRKIFNDFFILRIADDFSCFLIKMFSRLELDKARGELGGGRRAQGTITIKTDQFLPITELVLQALNSSGRGPPLA